MFDHGAALRVVSTEVPGLQVARVPRRLVDSLENLRGSAMLFQQLQIPADCASIRHRLQTDTAIAPQRFNLFRASSIPIRVFVDSLRDSRRVALSAKRSFWGWFLGVVSTAVSMTCFIA